MIILIIKLRLSAICQAVFFIYFEHKKANKFYFGFVFVVLLLIKISYIIFVVCVTIIKIVKNIVQRS